MSNVIVVGSQWGDEGKGKIVDWLSQEADVIVRFQGGHNAGHTLVIDGNVYKLSLLPSGVVRRDKVSIIGNGVVVDPWALMEEISTVVAQGVHIHPETLMIAENAPLILPLHRQVDAESEFRLGGGKIGTTGRGIGPAYEDKVARRALRMCDLSDDNALKARLEALVAYHNIFRKGQGAELISYEQTLDELLKVRDKITPFIAPVWQALAEYNRQGKRILFEGAQGVMLDADYGTYPFVTSSNTLPGTAFTGSGLGVGHAHERGLQVLGITKAYTTRVGSGPMPTQQDNDIGKRLGERGHEFGTVTGRRRRCGWFDAVQVRQAATIAGITGLVITKLDVLDGFEELKICVGYKDTDGREYDYLPAAAHLQERLKPIYETLPGWADSTNGVRNIDALPDAARRYITRIEELTGARASIISTSPERSDTILLHDPFA